MKQRLGLSLVLLLCAAAHAADPPAPAGKAVKPSAAKPARSAPLNLRIGDVRRYLTPADFQAALNAPDADANSVVVEGTRQAAPLQSQNAVPGGLASLWYALRKPTQSWRILLPDVNAPAMGPTWDKVPPPIFRWGP